MRERLINRRRQGDLGEVSAIEWFTRKGATVSAPLGHSPDYDLVAEVDGRLSRVQVKTSVCRLRTPDGHERHVVRVATSGGNQSWTRLVKHFDRSRSDFLFILTGDGRRWLIPADAMEATNSIQLGGIKYSEFEIDPGHPIAELVYGDRPTLESAPRQGEYPSGQRTAPVKRQAYAFAGSNPASPTNSTSRSAVERKLGRAGQAVVRDKRQMTLPLRPFTEAGLGIGDRIRFHADGPGRIVLERIEPPANTLLE